MCLMEKISRLYKPCSDMSHSALCVEINVNESIIHIKWDVLTQKHMETRFCIDQLMKM